MLRDNSNYVLTFKELVHKLVYQAWWSRDLYGKDTRVIAYNMEKLSIDIEDRMTMAARSKGKTEEVKPDYQQIKWVNRNLDDAEKKEHDNASVKPVELFKDVLALCNNGYNVSVKWDNYSACFQSTLIPYNPADPNYGYGLSARAADPFRSLSLLLFKHFSVMGERWAEFYKAASKGFEG